MKRSFWNRKIPTHFGLLLLLLTVITTVLLLKNNQFINIRANPSNTPSFVRISNVSDSSFTVSYTTATSVTGSVAYGQTQTLGTVVLDDKDKTSGSPNAHQIHFFTITNLKPKTQYYFTILSGNETFNNQNIPYTVTTGDTIGSSATNQFTINGKIHLLDGTIPKEAVAYAQVGTNQLLSTQVSPDGTYKFTFAYLRSNDLKTVVFPQSTDPVALTFYGDGYESSVTTTMALAANIPDVTLTQDYTFTATGPVTPTQSASESAHLPTFSNNQPANTLQILVPDPNTSQSFTDSQPQFSGTAIPKSTVQITIQTDNQITDSVQADDMGNWTYRISKALTPGFYVLSVSGVDSTGASTTLSSSFSITTSGSNFTEPSVKPTKIPATPTPTSVITIQPTTVVPTVTITPALTPFMTPVASASPTMALISPTIFVTDTPIPTMMTTGMMSPQPTMASPGSNELMISIGFVLISTVIGGLLFFLIHV